jgi:hypothetical protein
MTTESRIDLDKLETEREAVCADKADLFDFYHTNWGILVSELRTLQRRSETFSRFIELIPVSADPEMAAKAKEAVLRGDYKTTSEVLEEINKAMLHAQEHGDSQ